MRTIEYSVTQTGISPSTMQRGGVQDDHNAVVLKFTLGATLVEALKELQGDGKKLCYRFDAYDGEGAMVVYDSAVLVFESEVDTVLSFPLENRLTHSGGRVEVYLVITLSETNTVDGGADKTEMELYSFPAIIDLKQKPDATESADDIRTSLTTLAESAKSSEESAKASEENAAASAESAQVASQSAKEYAESIEDAGTVAQSALEKSQEANEKYAACVEATGKANDAAEKANDAADNANNVREEVEAGGFIESLKEMNKGAKFSFWVGTEAEYNALTEKIDGCFYIITDNADYTDFVTLKTDVADLKTNVETLKTDYIKEQGTENGWTYRKWASGIAECWRTDAFTIVPNDAWGSMYTQREVIAEDELGGIELTSVALPTGLFKAILSSSIDLCDMGYVLMPYRARCDTDELAYSAVSLIQTTETVEAKAHYFVIGRWK